MRYFPMPSRGVRQPMPSKSRPRWPASALLAVIGLSGASCALLADEDSLPPSPTIAVVTSPAPTASTTLLPSTTTTSIPATTTSAPSTTTTSPSVGVGLLYLEQLLTVGAGFAQVAESIEATNNAWENRAGADVSFAETEAALAAAVSQVQALRDSFALIVPPPESVLEEEHRIAQGAVEIMVDTASQMLEGLQSTDTGQTRRAAVVGFLTAFDLFGEVPARLAAILGEEGKALLAAERVAPDLSDPDVSDTASTTVASDVPPNPGNTRNCSDFSTHEEAQEWFDTYYPHYGDIAQIDTNNNQVACEALLNPDPG